MTLSYVNFLNQYFQHTSVLDKYPDEAPAMKILTCIGEEVECTVQLENCAVENIGCPMLYTLISKALDIVSSLEMELNEKEDTKVQCKFFKEGKCRFGAKCFNLHGNSLESKSVEARYENTEPDQPIEQDTIDDKSKKSSKINKNKNKTQHVEANYTEKKSSMKTAMDVINRILWDDSFPTEQFAVGYLDRFLGVQEKPFSAFSWEDIASVDYNVLAIPKHRIQYFKYKTVIVWDKNDRLDLVFGSTGNDVSIMDVIESESDKSVLESIVKDENVHFDEDDNTDNHYFKYDSKNRPNYFFALRISDDEVKENIVKVSFIMLLYHVLFVQPLDCHYGV